MALADNWLDYPLDLVKLCEILSTYKNVLFLGGDIHRNGFQEPILLKDILEILKPNWLTTEAWNKLRTPLSLFHQVLQLIGQMWLEIGLY